MKARAIRRLDTEASRCEECGTPDELAPRAARGGFRPGASRIKENIMRSWKCALQVVAGLGPRRPRRAYQSWKCALQVVAGLGPRRPRRAYQSWTCALQVVAGLGPRRPRRAYQSWTLLALALSGL